MHDSKCNCGGGSCHGRGCTPAMIGRTLLIIGGINWGLIGIGMLTGYNLNVIGMLFGTMPAFEAVIYVAVGIAAVVRIFGCGCKRCMGMCGTDGKMGGHM